MLLSMTGFGEARREDEHLVATIEVRAINNRYFKINTRCSDGYPGLESQIEALVRQQIRRGTVQVNVRIDRIAYAGEFALNEEVLNGYREQLELIHARWHRTDPVSLESLLLLPGVIDDRAKLNEPIEAWTLVRAALDESMQKLAAMRAAEGEAMAADLAAQLDTITAESSEIQKLAPRVAGAYRERLNERINKVLAEQELRIEPPDIIREVTLFAERCDISEEIVRLDSHVEQFRETIGSSDAAGRRLEFLTQEMFREANTMGSKANDADISRRVIEIKAAIERIREMVQNVE